MDATGSPIDPSKLYSPLSPYGRVIDGAPRVYGEDHALLGSHAEVVAVPSRWCPVDMPTDAKNAARRARYEAAMADVRPARDDRFDAPPRIPQARRMIATETFYAGPHFVKRGAERDVDDDVVKRAPEYFRPAIEPDEAAWLKFLASNGREAGRR